MTNNVYWTLEATVNDGKLEEFKALGAEMCAASEKEEGTLNYEFHLREDGKAFYSYERFASSSAALAHLGSFGAFAERFMSVVTLTGFNAFGDISDELRAAIADFQSPKWNQLAGFAR